MNVKALRIASTCVAACLLASCSHNLTKLHVREDLFKTGKSIAGFHELAEEEHGSLLGFPGYIVGIEKSPIQSLGLGKSSRDSIVRLVQSHYTDKTQKKTIERVLNDPKLTFVSHIARFGIESDSNKPPYSTDTLLFNAYDTDQPAEHMHHASANAIKALKDQILAQSKSQKYTHILFYSMGWNTSQREAVRNYNSLVTQLLRETPPDTEFRPLFIGLTWPSEWQSLKAPSYAVKTNDADEVGFVWGETILNDVLIPVKRSLGIPLVLVGHSLGARVVTRAAFSSFHAKPVNTPEIDLIVGLEGAFSINRFIPGLGNEGSPYSEYPKVASKIVLTWSTFDNANPVAKYVTGADHVGGYLGDARAKQFFTIFSRSQMLVRTEHDATDLLFGGLRTSQVEPYVIGDGSRVEVVDASKLILHDVNGKGGTAHSDIYTRGLAQFIWTILPPSTTTAQ